MACDIHTPAAITAPNVTAAPNAADTRMPPFSRPIIMRPLFIRIEITEAD
jgi:hypothetical protein